MLNKLKLKSDFSRNVLTLMTGTTLAQAIPIAISPILTRLYSPEDFGLVAIYISIATLLTVIATARYEMAIMLPKKDNDSINLVFLSLFITISISICSFIFILFFNKKITELLNNNEISMWLYFIPLSVLMTGSYNTFNYWINRKKEYTSIAKSRVIQSMSTGTSNLSLGFYGLLNGTMIFGQILGQSIATLFLFKVICNKYKNKIIHLNKTKMIALAKKYRKFPLINMFHAFINILKDNFINIFIAVKYSQVIIGYYFFMIKIMKLPAGILGSSIAQVFYRSASEEFNKSKNIRLLVIKLLIKLSIISFFPILILYLYSENLFIFIFGKEWGIAGIYAQEIAPYIFFHFLASPLGMIPLITNNQGTAFFWGLFESVLFISVFTIGTTVYNDLAIVLNTLSIVMGLYFSVYFTWIVKISKVEK